MASVYDDAAQALRDRPLYVDPTAARELETAGIPFGDDARKDAQRTLETSATPIYLAVLPNNVRQSGLDASDLARLVGRDGTYVVLLPDGSVGAVSNTVGAAAAAARSVQDESTDVSEFVAGIVSRFNEMAEGSGGSRADGGSNDSSSGGGWLPLAIFAAGGAGGFLLYRRKKINKERAQVEQVRNALDEDITAYGEQLSGLNLDVRTDSTVPIEARSEYSRALDLYEEAKSLADRAEKPADLQPVTNALEEGRWLLGCVDARLTSKPLPERRLPCFFNPSHGPSTQDIEWAPPGGITRVVPACAADARRVGEGADPDVRMVPVGAGQRRPYWDAGPAYGGWAGGYYGGFLPGMLAGTMLGSVLTGPDYVGGSADDGGGFDNGSDDWGDDGGFDGGGGDWGG